MSSSASENTTAAGKSPAFQFYANDFATGTADLSAEEVGIYIRLLCAQWDKGSIPGELDMLSRIARVPLARMRKAWVMLRAKFIADPNNPAVVARESPARGCPRTTDRLPSPAVR
jgi:hypothetical protein